MKRRTSIYSLVLTSAMLVMATSLAFALPPHSNQQAKGACANNLHASNLIERIWQNLRLLFSSNCVPQGNPTVVGSAEDLRVNVGDTVHFEYASYTFSDSDKVVLQRQAAWLSKYPSVKVTIEGHASGDEAKTREEALALSARRANNEREYLVSLGIDAARIDTISYGKERPLCTADSDACFALNRRGVTTVTSGAPS